MLGNSTQLQIAQLAEQGKASAKQAELAYQANRDAADRAANEQATQAATQTELQQQASQERLGRMTSMLELIQDQQKSSEAMLMARFEAKQEADMLVLKEVLEGMSKQIAAQPDATGQAAGLENLVAPIAQQLMEAMGGIKEEHRNSLANLTAQHQNFVQAVNEDRGATQATLGQLQHSLGAIQTHIASDRHADFVRRPDGTASVRSYLVPPSAPAP